jgi:rhodanese-related sulfurtransferase
MAIDGCISSGNRLASPSFQVTVQGDVMAVELEERVIHASHAALEAARTAAAANQLPYAGGVSPRDAFALLESGSVPGSIHVAWATGTSLTRNPRFVRELEAKTGKDAIVLLLCRSGNRSALAAEAATKAGFTQVFNVLEGFEGRLDSQQRRGAEDGWRFQGLPWIQD